MISPVWKQTNKQTKTNTTTTTTHFLIYQEISDMGINIPKNKNPTEQ